MRVALLPVGSVRQDALEALREDLQRGGLRVDLLPPAALPPRALNRRRGQHRAPALLEVARAQEGEFVLAVTAVDLYAKPLNFVFGQAEVGGRVAVISLHRLEATDPALARQRALKEALHELGHTRGLSHCAEATCVMHFSNTLADTDRKGAALCGDCAARLTDGLFWRQG